MKIGMLTCDTSGYIFNPLEMVAKSLDKDNLDIFLAPEYLFRGLDNIYRTQDYTKNLFQLQKISKNHKNTLMFPGTILWTDDKRLNNDAWAFDSGEMVFSYAKKKPAINEMILINKHNLIMNNDEDVLPLNWNNKNIGVEICLDHSFINDNCLLKYSGVKNLDMQILLSCGIRTSTESLIIKNNGIFMRTDGFYNESELLKKIDNKYIHIPFDDIIRIETKNPLDNEKQIGYLNIYEI